MKRFCILEKNFYLIDSIHITNLRLLFNLPIWRKRFSIVLLSITLPMSLLAGLRLTGILEEPPTPEVVVVKPASWSTDRPTDFKDIDELVNNSYADDLVSIDYVVHVLSYYENDAMWGGFDVVMSMVLVNMSISEGYVESLFVDFAELDEYAALDIHDDMDHIEVVNLEVAEIADWDWVFGRNAYIRTKRTNQPKNVYLQFLFAWLFRDHNDASHKITATLKAAYLSGTTYWEVRIPIKMEVSQS